jgi:NADPH:quinone reductase-like Zn-dependent oxidoreductase
MKAIVMRETGGVDVLKMEDAPDPEVDDGLVLVRVHTASVNPIDWKFRSGMIPKPLPAILGNDMAGVVEASRVTGIEPGQAVLGIASAGSYAELASTPGQLVAPMPDGLDYVHAAALPVAAMTAWQALFDRGGLKEGQSVLIAGAAGGVGHLAVQLARRAGARTIALGSPRNRDFLTQLGATDYVDYTSEDVAGAVSDVDVVFDTVGGELSAALGKTVKQGGVVVAITAAQPETVPDGVRYEHLVMSPDPEQLAMLARLAADGELNVEIAEVLGLSEVQHAHELSESGHTRGKIILEVDR